MSRGSAGTEPGVGRGLSLESGTDELQRAEVGSGWGPGTVVAAVPRWGRSAECRERDRRLLPSRSEGWRG